MTKNNEKLAPEDQYLTSKNRLSCPFKRDYSVFLKTKFLCRNGDKLISQSLAQNDIFSPQKEKN
jgi:hypothetical protein